MYLHEILGLHNKESMLDICRSNEISGFAKLRKDELVQHISENLHNDEDQLFQLIESYDDSTKFLLKLIAKSRNGIGKEKKIKKRFTEIFSIDSYYTSLIDITVNRIVFELSENDVELLIIPTEFLSRVRKCTKKYEIENLVKEVINEVDDDNITLEKILNKAKKAQLKSFCEKKKIQRTGTKQELVERIIELEDPNIILKAVNKPVLLWACEKLNCETEGYIQEIRDRILMKIIPDYVPLYDPNSHKGNKGETNENQEENVDDDTPIIQTKEFLNLGENLISHIEDIPFDIETVKDERMAELNIFVALKAQLKDYSIIRGSKKKQENVDQPDIFIENGKEKAFVEVKFIQQKKYKESISEMKDQVFNFKTDYPDHSSIFFVYDKGGKMGSQDIIRARNMIDHFIYKTQEDYSVEF